MSIFQDIAHKVSKSQLTFSFQQFNGEVIFDLSVTLDGQTTMHYVRERITLFVTSVSSFAHGVTIGGEIDYLYDGTLSTAMTHRYKVA